MTASLPAAERFARLDGLLAEALDREPAERARFLDIACADDPSLREEMEQLVALAEREAAWEDVLGAAGAIARDDLAALPRLPDAIGAWRVLRPIGRGGMADVVLAERTCDGFTQQAALKVMHTATADPHAITRFEQERRILATLADPRIARFYDGGLLPDGRPWTAMEYVDGIAIDAWCDAQHLGVDARIALVLELIAAVASAHRGLVVHRDIKPGNVLVTIDGHLKLLDFGIAKVIGASAETTAMPWRAFTPQYAAPEQLLDGLVTTATDTYQIGLVLYELLVGRRPFQDDEQTLPRLVRAVAEREPPSLSRALAAPGSEDAAAIAQARAMPLARLRRRVRGDLSLVVARALARDPAQRYETVAQFGEDLRRHLDGRPVRAAKPSVGYRLRKFVARHRVGVAAVVALGLAIVAGIVGTVWQANEALRQRDQARIAAAKSERLVAFLVDAFAHADPSRTQGERVTARDVLARARARLDDELPQRDAVRADLLAAIASAYSGLGLRAERTPMALEALAIERTLARPAMLRARLLDAATALRDDSRADDAWPLLVEVEALMAADAATTTLERGRAKFLRGMIHFSRRELVESEAALADAVALLRQAAPDGDDLRVASLMLSRRLVTAGRGDEGIALARDAVARARAASPPRPSDLADALDALGSAYDKLGRRDEQVATYREAHALALQVFGPDHLSTGILAHNLALAHEKQGDLDAARALSAEALRVAGIAVAPTHNFTLAATVANTRIRCAADERVVVDPAIVAHVATLPAASPLHERLAATQAACAPP